MSAYKRLTDFAGKSHGIMFSEDEAKELLGLIRTTQVLDSFEPIPDDPSRYGVEGFTEYILSIEKERAQDKKRIELLEAVLLETRRDR